MSKQTNDIPFLSGVLYTISGLLVIGGIFLFFSARMGGSDRPYQTSEDLRADLASREGKVGGFFILVIAGTITGLVGRAFHSSAKRESTERATLAIMEAQLAEMRRLQAQPTKAASSPFRKSSVPAKTRDEEPAVYRLD